ncbi:MAG: galactokinase [Treponema sp.]|uniref:galactokinase n=1 Tax=Treponema sp. TaxID=166 RepID=UPI001B779A43|nr:galactokinase [Treponema sp.]MBP3771973.1 galactokinase [Treponema sp.]MBQ9280955.1 galactokinase [Treponema sp.]
MGLTEKEYNPKDLPSEFVKMYGGNEADVAVYASPARINIIGEHIDYNGGKVFPAAIDRYLYVAIRKRGDSKIIYNDVRFPGTFEFDINDDFAFDKKNDYANYLNGILSQLKAKGYTLDSGFEILMVSNVPAGGGISSSSALECGFAYAVSETFKLGIDRIEIAKLGQMSEHNFMNVNCGIMDQFIIATGKKNTAEMLDCATLDYEYAPLELGDYRFVVMNTNKVRKLSDSKYNERRSQCEQALKILNEKGVAVSALCELTPAKWEEVRHFVSDEILQKRAKHCVFENQRVLDAVSALKEGNLEKLGSLLNASHASLKTDYEVTGIELDTLAETAQKQEGCLGARMTGAGFGGCGIALVHKDCVDSFIEKVQKEYTDKIGYAAGFFVCETGDGVSRIK